MGRLAVARQRGDLGGWFGPLQILLASQAADLAGGDRGGRALMTDVLPKALDRGQDLGVINVANALPQVAAPALAAPIVTYLGGSRGSTSSSTS